MARKSTTLRVHHLAKELGVNSKDIVAKCGAEEVPGVTNHMSAVSMGLAATIREWFTEGEQVQGEGGAATATAVERAAKVDLTKARARAKKKASKKKVKKKVEKKAEEKVEEKKEEQKKKPEAKPAKAAAAPPAVKAPPAVAAEAPGAAPVAEPAPVARKVAAAPAETVAEPPRPAAAETRPQPTAKKNVPDRPEVIKPAGPMLEKPAKTNLSGPKVIRVESPEIIAAPKRQRPGPGDRGPARGGRGAGAGYMDAPEGRGAPPGRGGRGGGAGGGAPSRRNKRRSASARDDSPRQQVRSLEAGDRGFNWREQDLLEREQRLNRAGGFFRAARRDNLKRSTPTHRASSVAQTGGKVRVEAPIFVKELSAATGVKAGEILKKLLLSGASASQNEPIENETAQAVMLEYGIELDIVEQKSAAEQIAEQFTEREIVDLQPRSPVVTILGHVDHGKTSLLDRIRNANVASGEAGGITQATSAFRVPVRVSDTDRRITFIDTPGHEAFTQMRARGARITDVVVLVVAADDGVMPQTVESINHARDAGVPIIVALNKIDKAEATDANIQRILGQLAEHELNPTEWGGSTEVVRVSALKNEGIQDLLDVIDYQAQLLELQSDAGGPAEGSVIEAQVEEGRGPVARVLVQQGQLRKGDYVVVGRAYGRVRDIVNDRGQRIEEAGPSTPVAFSGIDEVPDAGDKFYVVQSQREAEAAADERRTLERERDLVREKVTLDNIFEKLSESERKELPLIVKADVQGSVETLRATLEKISNQEITIAIKHAAVGGVNDSDVTLAEAAGAIIICFNVTAPGRIRKLAEERGVDIRFYDVIYDLTEDVTRAAEGLLEPEHKIEILGHAEVRDVFRISKVGMVAGCYVTDGTIQRNAQIRVTRDEIVIEKDRRLEQLKRFKDDAKEVRAGQECGMKIEGYSDIQVGDVLECYKKLEVRRQL